jgi:hypothetical protein
MIRYKLFIDIICVAAKALDCEDDSDEDDDDEEDSGNFKILFSFVLFVIIMCL